MITLFCPSYKFIISNYHTVTQKYVNEKRKNLLNPHSSQDIREKSAYIHSPRRHVASSQKHTYMHTYTGNHTYAQTYTHTNMHSHIHTHTHMYSFSHTIYSQMHTQSIYWLNHSPHVPHFLQSTPPFQPPRASSVHAHMGQSCLHCLPKILVSIYSMVRN